MIACTPRTKSGAGFAGKRSNGLITRSRTIFSDPMAHPSVGGRSVGNYLVSICHHPFLVFGEGPEGLRAPTEFLDVLQRRGLVRKTSELGRFVTIVLRIRHWTTLAKAISPAPIQAPQKESG